MRPKIACHLIIQDCFILEGDEEDYYKLKHIDKEIIQKSFNIPYKDMPILIKMFKQLEYSMIQYKLICSLIRNQKYYITCISFDIVNYIENNHESIKIEINILLEEICDEMYQLDDGSIILFCIKQFNLIQYSVNLNGDVILLLEYNISDQIQDKCKKIQYNKDGKNQFIIAFIQCSKWKIFEINHQEIQIILESQMQDYQPILKQFKNISGVQFCQLGSLTLLIFEEYNYLQINYEPHVGTTYEFLKVEYLILNIIPLRKMCISNIIIIYQKQTNLQPFQKINNYMVLNYTYDVDNIHLYSNYLFIQNQTQLIIRIDQHLIQKYEILNSSLIFFDQYNLFYQIDKTKLTVQFYRYFPISSFIEPKLKYIYIIMKLDLINTQSLNSCIRIQYENKTIEQKHQLAKAYIYRNCELKQETKLPIQNIFRILQQQFTVNNNNINLSIWNEANTDFICYQRLKSYKFKSKNQLRSIQSLNYLVFQNENFIYFHNCQQNKIEMIINTNQYQVLQYLDDYYLIDKKNKQLKVITFILGYLNQIVLYNNIEIIKAEQIQQSLIIHVKNEKFPILITKNSFQYQNIYLSEQLIQSEQILFYQNYGTYQFIQYPNLFAFEYKGEVYCFQFSDLLIISVKNWLKGLFQIYVIQNETNSILLYYTNTFELHQFYNYTLQEYKFSNPLKYICSLNRIAILTEQNQSFFIALFSYSDTSINLIDIIETDDIYFEILNNTLIYLKNQQIRQFYLNEVVALIKTNISIQKSLYIHFQQILKSSSKLNNEDIDLSLLFQNECYQLFTLKNSISLKLFKYENLYLKISEMFQGSINNLTIVSNLQIYLKNPFQSIYQINYCNNEIQICIEELKFKKQIQTQKIWYSFFVIVYEDKTICQILQPKNDDHLNQVFWISDYTFIWFGLFDNGLNVRLLECSLQMNGNCKEIQILDINFFAEKPLSSNIIKSENLVKIQNSLEQIYLYISNQNFTLIQLPDIHFDIQYVQDTENLFIALSDIDRTQVKLIIYQINFNGYVKIFSKIITQEIENALLIQDKFLILQIISCQLNVNIIIVNIMLKNQRNFFMIKLNINIQDGFIISYHLQKEIRNQLLDNQYIFDYVDENYLVLNLKQVQGTLLYDLQEDRLFYDYNYFTLHQIQITRINTTHFTFMNNSQISIGIIQQYEIDLQNIDNINFNFILYAQNDLSNTQIQINVTREISLNNLNKNIILIELTNFFFILFRIMCCRNKQKKYTTQ
ncbi:unnamed protein product [Paramecium primaurelia]|uniref:Transmembrane protein n=1 Tax=Paramecium primaurelia TaxID=5886 RepID=A0A8S1PVG4_PARPR|nr:unnamed protein product [Paramecium primaurelia]